MAVKIIHNFPYLRDNHSRGVYPSWCYFQGHKKLLQRNLSRALWIADYNVVSNNKNLGQTDQIA